MVKALGFTAALIAFPLLVFPLMCGCAVAGLFGERKPPGGCTRCARK